MKKTMDSSGKNYSYTLRALNIIDYEERCRLYMSIRAPKVEKALFSLETLAEEFKLLTDQNGVEYDTFPLFRFLGDLPTSLPLQTDGISLLTKLRYFYFNNNLTRILGDNLFNEYLYFVRRTLKKLCPPDMRTLLKKFIIVLNILQPEAQLSTQDFHQYELAAELLKHCYDLNIQDSSLVVALLKTTIDMQAMELSNTGHVKQPSYPSGFLKYILDVATKENFDLQCYCRNHSRTLWEYSRNLSVVNAVSLGNTERVMCLLQHGFEVFPGKEVRKYSHRFPFIEAVMPETFLMNLQMMAGINRVNRLIQNCSQISNPGLDTATKNQKECFELVWRSIPKPFVKHAELDLAVSTEFLYFAIQNILNPVLYEKNTSFCDLYEKCFNDMATGPNEPRSLKHLCRCTIRKNLHKSSCLPKGIFHLKLPKILENYLNLEIG